ncbi:MAG: thioredoxin family protein [Deltaproteobacteria bacterium]|nr:thioredoxin family protein [Deltaproteobacteria bacterium]
MEREAKSSKFPIGSKLPIFTLPAAQGGEAGSDTLTGAKLSLVAFTCNHCPYVKGSEEMLVATVREFEGQGLRAIAISSNDAAQYPEDGFDAMKVKAEKMNLPYPYLYDEGQQVARLFDAECTPEVYLFNENGVLIYHGAINDSPRDPSKVTVNFIEKAIKQALSGGSPDPAFERPIGCSIKWTR